MTVLLKADKFAQGKTKSIAREGPELDPDLQVCRDGSPFAGKAGHTPEAVRL